MYVCVLECIRVSVCAYLNVNNSIDVYNLRVSRHVYMYKLCLCLYVCLNVNV